MVDQNPGIRSQPGNGRADVVGDLEDLCGMRASPVCSIRLVDCRLPTGNLLAKEGMGLKIGLAALDTGRIGIGAQALGIAQAALEEAVRYARQRRQFGVGGKALDQPLLVGAHTLLDQR